MLFITVPKRNWLVLAKNKRIYKFAPRSCISGVVCCDTHSSCTLLCALTKRPINQVRKQARDVKRQKISKKNCRAISFPKKWTKRTLNTIIAFIFWEKLRHFCFVINWPLGVYCLKKYCARLVWPFVTNVFFY